jgi:hypothetical protein
MERLGARIDKVRPYDRWWQALETSSYGGGRRCCVHPFRTNA